MASVKITNAALDEVQWELVPQSFVVQNYLNAFNLWEVQLHYELWVIYLLYRRDATHSEVYRYDKDFKARLPDTYEYGSNFMKTLKSIWSTRYTNISDSFIAMSWFKDMWVNIDQYIKAHWPVDNYMNLWCLDMVKMKIWFDWFGIWGKVRICTWWTRKTCKSYDLEWISVVAEINAEVDADWTLWSSMLWQLMLGWFTNNRVQELLDIYSEYIDVSFNTAWFGEWGYYTYEIRNKTQRQLIIAGLQPQININSPSDKYNKTTVPSGTPRSFT